MIVSFSKEAWDDYLFWQQTDQKKLKRVNEFIKVISRDPYEGTGKPEHLRNEWSGWWSRRIDREHRLVYKVTEEAILVAQCRYQY